MRAAGLGLGLLLPALLGGALPAGADAPPRPVPQTAPAESACPDAAQRNQCRQRCSPVRTIFGSCAGAGDEEPAACRDTTIARCLEECLAEQCRTG